MFIHSKLEYSTVNGPGTRVVIWFQGCVGMNCPGCWNPDTHASFCGETLRADQLADWVLAQRDITGVTFSGGEPLQQAPALLSVIEILHGRNPHLSFGLYTGYTAKELDKGHYVAFFSNHKELVSELVRIGLWERIRKRLDFAIMGRYNRLAPIQTTLRASRNQNLELFSGRYSLADFSQNLEIEAVIDSEFIQLTGFPMKGIEL